MTNFTGTIVTLGGGGFSQEGAVTPIDEHILELTRAERPRVCFVPTASGDDLDALLAAAERAFAAVSGRYEVGMANFIDVASAQTALAQARAAREQASVNQSLARARLGLATGRAVPGGAAAHGTGR